MLAAEFQRSVLGHGTLHASLGESQESGVDYVVEALLSDRNDGPRLALYSFYAPRTGPGLEVVVEGTLSPKANIRIIPSDVLTECKMTTKTLSHHGGV